MAGLNAQSGWQVLKWQACLWYWVFMCFPSNLPRNPVSDQKHGMEHPRILAFTQNLQLRCENRIFGKDGQSPPQLCCRSQGEAVSPVGSHRAYLAPPSQASFWRRTSTKWILALLCLQTMPGTEETKEVGDEVEESPKITSNHGVAV